MNELTHTSTYTLYVLTLFDIHRIKDLGFTIRISCIIRKTSFIYFFKVMFKLLEVVLNTISAQTWLLLTFTILVILS